MQRRSWPVVDASRLLADAASQQTARTTKARRTIEVPDAPSRCARGGVFIVAGRGKFTWSRVRAADGEEAAICQNVAVARCLGWGLRWRGGCRRLWYAALLCGRCFCNCEGLPFRLAASPCGITTRWLEVQSTASCQETYPKLTTARLQRKPPNRQLSHNYEASPSISSRCPLPPPRPLVRPRTSTCTGTVSVRSYGTYIFGAKCIRPVCIGMY